MRADDAHWMDVWNFSLAGSRLSIGVGNESENLTRPEDVDLEVLRSFSKELPQMFLSGFLSTIAQGAIVRAGHALGQGLPPYPTRWATEEEAARTLQAADRELHLEATRRLVAPERPSRLSCLWLAEDTIEGRNWVQTMVGEQAFIMRVRVVAAKAVHRCDADWLELIEEDADGARAYWAGEPRSDDPRWEYLVDGKIESVDPEELERLRAFVRDQGPPPDLMGPPLQG